MRSITDTVVAVPRSKIISGSSYASNAATAPTARSAPSCAGLSILILRPDFIPGPTMRGERPVSSFIAWLKVLSSWGTDEETIAPSIFRGEN